MKKNISINIGGILFHIEEDGYEKLQNYLSQINAYFKKYEDSTEIINDIEGRISEIFLNKLDKEKEVISSADIDDLISKMGTVADFASMEEGEEQSETESEPNFQSQSVPNEDKKFYRDTQRKLIGGVCSGIAHYYAIDPLWSRVFFLILFFGFFFIPPASALAVILYIALWIAFPAKDDIEEDKKIKKLYRNPEDKVISGVSSGLAAYFNVDTAIVRLIFVLSFLFFGTGLIIYIALWFITPEANSMTEKIQMKGDPVTLSSIESSVKEKLQPGDPENENAIVSVLLFPFRLLGRVFTVLGRALGPILDVLGKLLRVAIGLFFMFISFVMLVSVLMAFGVFLGMNMSPELWLDGFPLDVAQGTVPLYAAVSAFVAIGIPAFAIGVLGLRVIILRSILNTGVAWGLFGIWFVAAVLSFSSLPGLIKSFSTENEIVESQIFESEGKTMVLDLREIGMDSYDAVELRIRPHDENFMKLEKTLIAQGSNRMDAEKNAEMITYTVTQKDSVLLFDSNVEFKKDAIFRAQEASLILYMPLNQKFVMTDDLGEIIRNTIYYYGYDVMDMGSNIFVFEDSDELSCLTCEYEVNDSRRYASRNEYTRSFDVSDQVRTINIKGKFQINWVKGDEYRIEASGKRSSVEEVEVDYDEDDFELDINNGSTDEKFTLKGRSKVNLFITIPDADEINLMGFNDLKARGLNYDNMEINLQGVSEADITGVFNSLTVNAEGLSEIDLEGEAQYFEASLAGKSEMDASDFETLDADVEAVGNSEAKVMVTGYLNAFAAGFSEIDYYGNPRLDKKVQGFSSINRK